MQGRKTRAIGVDGEHRATAPIAASRRCPVQRVARYKQFGLRISSITPSEIMQGRKRRAIGVDREHRAVARTAATFCRPVKEVTR